MAELSESAVYVSTQQNKSWIGNTYLYVSAVKNRGETGTPSIYATVRNTGTMVDGYSIFASIKSKTAFVCADIDTRVTRGNDRLAIVAPGLLDNGVWLQDGSFSVNCGGGLSGTASAYKVFNGRWTGYCNYFNQGAWIEICMPNPVNVVGAVISSADGYLPFSGDMFF